jgi:TRAP-type C4-dicarboxylate transport system permease small subunit
MMTVLIFSDVVLRTFTRPVGKTAALLMWVLEGDEPLSKATQEAVANVWGPALFGLLLLALCLFGVHASRIAKAEHEKAEAPVFTKSAALGLVLFVALWGTVKALIWLFPTGIAGAQRFALGFMVWAGFVGASIATKKKRHILLDAVKKKLDAKAYPWFSALGAAVTATFTFTFAYLAYTKLGAEIAFWRDVPNAGNFESLPIPEWIVTLALPVTFSLIGLRFLAQGVSDLLYGPSLVVEKDELAREIAKLEEDAAEAAPPPFDNGTRYGTEHPTTGRPEKREVAS